MGLNMPLRAASLISLSLILVLVLVAAVFIQQLDESMRRQNQLTRFRYEDYVLSSGLRQSSDDLTRMVRLYAVTGDRQYRQFFDRILAIRNGEASRPELYFEIPWWDFVLASREPPGGAGEAAPLRTLVQGGSFASEEIALLEEAENRSNDLARIENDVMSIVAAQPGVAVGEYRLEGPALLAMQRLHDQEYHLAKERVMRPLAKLSEIVSSNLIDGRDELNGTILDTIWYVLLAIGFATLAGIFLLVSGRRREAAVRGNPRILAILLVLSLLTSIAWILQIYGEQNFVHDHLNRRFESYPLSDGLRQTSDDLTRMVRLYAVSGEERYRQYFNQILDIRDGNAPRPQGYFEIPYWDIALASGSHEGQAGEAVPFSLLAARADFTEEEYGFLDASEAMSNELVALENEVMALVRRRLNAGRGDYRLEDESLAAVLRLHGPEYHRARLKVMEPLAELLHAVERDFESANRHAHERIEQFNAGLSVSWGLSLLLVALALRAWWRA